MVVLGKVGTMLGLCWARVGLCWALGGHVEPMLSPCCAKNRMYDRLCWGHVGGLATAREGTETFITGAFPLLYFSEPRWGRGHVGPRATCASGPWHQGPNAHTVFGSCRGLLAPMLVVLVRTCGVSRLHLLIIIINNQ